MLSELRNRMKYIKTCNLYLSLFTLGMSMSVTGPCLLDLQHMVRTSTQQIAMVYTARSTGYLLGSIIGAILLDRIRSKQAVLLGCNFLTMVTMFGIPWNRSVETLLVFMCLNGLCLGAIETGGNVICLELWGKDSNPIFQGLHAAFGLGGLISPLIAAPFLENFKEVSRNMDNSTYLEEEFDSSSANFSSYVNNITQTSEDIPKIIYPFSVIGVIALMVTILHVVVCIISPLEDKSSQDSSKTEHSERSSLLMLFTGIFTFLAFFVVAGTEIGYGQTLTTFAVKGKLHLTATQGSYITSAFWGVFTLARFASVFLAIKVSSLKLLIGDTCLVAISAMILLFLMPNEWALWLASVVYGAGVASAYAALVGWINIHITISHKFYATFNIGCATGEMIIPFIIAYFIDTIPEMFSFVIAASAVLMAVLLFTLHCMFTMGSEVSKSKNVKCYVIDTVEREAELFSNSTGGK